MRTVNTKITITLTVTTEASDEDIAAAIASSLDNMVGDGTALGFAGSDEAEITITGWEAPSDTGD